MLFIEFIAMLFWVRLMWCRDSTLFISQVDQDIDLAVVDQGRGPEAKLRPEGPQKNFWRPGPPILSKGLDDRPLPPPPRLSQGLESSNTVRSLLKEVWRGKIPYVHFIANSIPGGAKIWSDAEERKGDLEFQESEIVWWRGLFFPVFGRWISFTFPSLFSFFLEPPFPQPCACIQASPTRVVTSSLKGRRVVDFSSSVKLNCAERT